MKRLIAGLLALFILAGMLPCTAFANNMQNTTSEAEYIFYTDLFYAYPYYLGTDSVFQEYSLTVEGLYDSVHTTYQSSSLIAGTALEFALRKITSPTQLSTLITDTLGLTNYSYNDALDAANEVVVANLLTESTAYSVEKSFGKTKKWINDLNKYVGYFNKLKLESSSGQVPYTAEYYTQQAYDYLWDNGCLSFIADEDIAKLWTEINASSFALSDCFTLAKTEVEIAQAFMGAIMMEDIRMEIVDDIIASQSSSTILKQGMTRLKSKLQKNFATYFVEEYLLNKLADDLLGQINTFALDAIGAADLASMLKIAHKVFVALVDAPTVEEVLKWQVLICYSADLATAIPQVAQSFDDGPFLSDEIAKYENLFIGYDAINKAAVNITMSIAEKMDP